MLHENAIQMKVRLPRTVSDFIKAEAVRNMRSANAEIVLIISDHMKRIATGVEFGDATPAAENAAAKEAATSTMATEGQHHDQRG